MAEFVVWVVLMAKRDPILQGRICVIRWIANRIYSLNPR